jgi:hypothetical protein
LTIESKSEFGFDQSRNVFAKIGRTFLMLIIGCFFLMFTAIIHVPVLVGWWVLPLRIAIDTCWTFWLLGLVYLWFESPWLKSTYLYCERHFLILIKTVFTAIVVGAIAYAIYLFATQ